MSFFGVPTPSASAAKAKAFASLCRRAANVFKLAYFPWVHEKTSLSNAKLYAWSMDKKAFKWALE